MGIIANLIFFLAIPAAISAGAAFALARLMPTWSLRRRTVIAATIAGALPVAIPIAALLATNGNGGDLVVALIALIVTGLVLMAAIGLPVALVVGRRNSVSDVDPKAFD